MPSSRARPRVFTIAIAALSALFVAGCRKPASPPAAPTAPPPPPEVSAVDLKAYRPNEAGAVMLVMYHRVEASRPESAMNRTPDQFRKDLQTLYDQGYRPVTVSEVAENRMEVPAGKTPIALTFDDSYRSQFSYLDASGSQIDPDCAVGIMEEFSRSHPDWPPKATFFILHGGKNPPAFYQHGLTAQKLAHLVEIGCEIGSHTYSHANFRRLSPDAISEEIGKSIETIQEMAPNAKVTSLAIPYGLAPRSAEGMKACISGSYKGRPYEMSAVVMASWRPMLAPIAKTTKKAPFAGAIAPGDPHRMERVLADLKQVKKPGVLEYCLQYFQDNPTMRYVSDGNPKVTAVPRDFEPLVDPEKVRSGGKRLQVYTVSTSTPSTPGR